MSLHPNPGFGELSRLGDFDLNMERGKNSATY